MSEKTQIDLLAEFIMANYPESIVNAGAGDVAINIIQQTKAENTLLKEQVEDLKLRLSGKTEFYCECGGIDKTKEQLVEAVKVIEFLRDEPHLSCRGDYCEQHGCDSYEFCTHVISKKFLQSLKGGK